MESGVIKGMQVEMVYGIGGCKNYKSKMLGVEVVWIGVRNYGYVGNRDMIKFICVFQKDYFGSFDIDRIMKFFFGRREMIYFCFSSLR